MAVLVKEYYQIVDCVMIFVMWLNLGFNAKFVLEKESKEIWGFYHKIAQLVKVSDSLGLDMELIKDLELVDQELQDLELWDHIILDLDMVFMALFLWEDMDLIMELIHLIIKNIDLLS